MVDESFMKNAFGDKFRRDEPLAKHCTLRVGGTATYWVDVSTVDDLDLARRFAANLELPLHVVGLGSNVLFGDDGIHGVVVRLVGDLASWSTTPLNDETAHVWIGAGTVNAHLVRGLLKEGWIGMEFLVLIPGTFGGAVAMNAGTREKELSSILTRVECYSPDEPRKVTMFDASQIHMTYRHTDLPDDSVVTAGVIEVCRGDVDAARERVRADKARRDATQPYRFASVGSTFANPDGDYAGRLIEAVGLKGYRVGGACISPLHANFFINEGSATALDFLTLMATARVRVRRAFGVELRPEVRFVGVDGWALLHELEAAIEGQL